MTVPPPWRLERYDSLPSTSDECRARAEAGEPAGLAVLAIRQTAGRGTHGRVWESPPGNLYLSVLLRPPGSVSTASLWQPVSVDCLRAALLPYLPSGRALSIKPPNDILLDGRKMAGVLVEAAGGTTGGIDWVVIGFGANLAAAPQVPDRDTAALGEAAPGPERFAAEVLERLSAAMARFGAEAA